MIATTFAISSFTFKGRFQLFSSVHSFKLITLKHGVSKRYLVRKWVINGISRYAIIE